MDERRPPDPPIVDIRDWPPESRTDRAHEELDREVGTTSVTGREELAREVGTTSVTGRDDLDVPLRTVAGPGGGYVDPGEVGVHMRPGAPDRDVVGRGRDREGTGQDQEEARRESHGGVPDQERLSSRGVPEQDRLSSPRAGDDPHVDSEAPDDEALEVEDPEGTGRYRTSDDADGHSGA